MNDILIRTFTPAADVPNALSIQLALDADKSPEQTWFEFTAATEAFLKAYTDMARATNPLITYEDVKNKYISDVLSIRAVSGTGTWSGPGRA